jgi:hypothetical protein
MHCARVLGGAAAALAVITLSQAAPAMASTADSVVATHSGQSMTSSDDRSSGPDALASLWAAGGVLAAGAVLIGVNRRQTAISL